MFPNVQLCPYIRRAWYDIMRLGTDIQDRVIFDFELMYIKAGSAEIIINGTSYIGKQGDLFIFRPLQCHSIRILGNMPLTQPHIHFDLEYREDREKVPVSMLNLPDIDEKDKCYFRRDILPLFFDPFPSCIHIQSTLYLEQMLFDVIHTYSQNGEYKELHLQWLFLRLWQQVLYEITLTHANVASKQKNEILPIIRMFIEQNLERDISLNELSGIAHFDPSYLIRVFKKEYNLSPMQYHASLRVEKARNLIRYTNMSIASIADQLGFTTPQDFSRTFKRIDGNPPSFYRRSIISIENV